MTANPEASAMTFQSLNTDHFRTTHVGSLPRSGELSTILWGVRDGEEIDDAARARLSRAELAAVVERQREVGLDVINDGEVNKTAFNEYIFERVAGFGGEVAPFVASDLTDYPAFHQKIMADDDEGLGRVHPLACVDDVRYIHSEPVRTEIAAFRDVAGAFDGRSTFMSAVTPGQITFNFPNQHYASHEAYLEAVAETMRQEYEAIAESGLILHLDSPDSAMAHHCRIEGSDVGEHRRHLELAVEALNHAVQNIPADQMRLHVCWGNYVGPHHRDVELKHVLDLVFKAKPATISFECANPRHAHEWELFRSLDLPDDKRIMPGVIDVKTPIIEHPRLVAERIERFAELVGKERVIAAPDCGFSTYAGALNVDSELAWAKLGSLVEGAAIASDRMF